MSDAYGDLRGKVAVVLGGSEGIGAATARLLAEHGARVAVCARRQEPLDALVGELRAGGAEAAGLAADAGDAAQLEAVRDEVLARFGGVNVLVAFAGGGVNRVAIGALDEDEWSSVLHRNLTSTFLAVRTFLPPLAVAAGASIITMGSAAGQQVDTPLSAAYAAAKAGVAHFTRHIAAELGPQGIRANCVAPSTTLSPRVARSMGRIDGLRDAVLAITPLGRLGEPVDVAQAAVYLASDASSWVTGVTLDVGGGRVLR